MLGARTADPRWELYKLLSDPMRLRVLALAAVEELSVGEIAELLEQPQPNVSRHVSPLRQAGLVETRRQGTRTLVSVDEKAVQDPVVADALATGRRLCRETGALSRVAEVVGRRDARTREFFARPGAGSDIPELAAELPAYLMALRDGPPRREVAVDVGTGDGVLLDVLAPLFDRVVALDRSDAQLSRARHRVQSRGYGNVELLQQPLGSAAVREAVGAGADLVMATRMLHHVPRPGHALLEMAALARPDGAVVVVDYARHEDVSFQERQADVWLGFEAEELEGFAARAGLTRVAVQRIPTGFVRSEEDGHLEWLTLSGRVPRSS